tara:strand:- start:34 stop:486 length:453 start_codon:yes stop_codon:yes gene_type:complete
MAIVKQQIGKFNVIQRKTFYITSKIISTSSLNPATVPSVTQSMEIRDQGTHENLGYRYSITNVSQSKDDLIDIISGSKVSQSFDSSSFKDEFEHEEDIDLMRYFNTTGSIEQSVYHLYGEKETTSTGSQPNDKEFILTISDSSIVKTENI